MVKNPRKRQKTGKIQHKPVPLGAGLRNDASKDDEERRLENLLFGVPYAPEKAGKEIMVISDEEAEDGQYEVGREFENLLDSDLFFVDDNAGLSEFSQAPQDHVQSDVEDNEELIIPEVPESDEDEEISIIRQDIPQQPKKTKAPAWTDPDDVNVQVSLASNNRLRKLRDAPSDDTVGGREYERRLRRQFEHINPTPDWASIARKKSERAKRRRSSASGSESGEDVVPELLASTAGILGTTKSRIIPPSTLSIERLRDANQAAPADGEIKTVAFHPSPHVPVLLTASADRRLRLFHIDGLTNPHAQTLHVPSLPITNAVFHPSGTSILMTGPRPFYYTYDLQSGASHRSPRGLWGTTFSSGRGDQGASMEISSFNPTGEILAVAGRRGHIHLVDWRSGAAQVMGELKANSNVKSLWWSKAGAGELLGLTEDSQVYVWNVGQRKCVKRWQDEGGFGSRLFGGDGQGKYLTVGSNTGLVNVYNAESTVDLEGGKPKTLKTIGNLTTSISTLRFNHDSQLLAIASNDKKDQMRMVHCPSLTAFGNWPTSSTPLGHVTSVDFSRESEYLAIGNTRGRVLLYQLRHFSQQ
ncbi:WD40-repeat-containing domain protein [Suillus subalutaceus]|uniref:WD40-repeat-containing domain protein n=1 Tax=Suillus subalutaceus TaxID=48586 RepID=UPI001B8777C2|nr:WD40-repeat-containing domain protein [Suillus subalutaceus]KAG1836822.1 WD40-repeat-containing domain protein [Suillus subalutaceus]